MWPFRSKKKGAGGSHRKRSPENLKERTGEEKTTLGAYVVTDTLDLHGFFPEQIPAMIRDFIDNARSLKMRRLRIIHGKGKSRLKWEVHQALKANPCVEAFGDASTEEGGWGATVILLKEEPEIP